LNAATEDLSVAQAHHLCKHSRSGHARRMGLDRARRTQNASHPRRWAML
jgi:hypothetical protein